MAMSSSPAGCFLVLPSPATVVGTGVPSHHAKKFSAGFLSSGGRLAVAVAVAVAAGAAMPGGSDGRRLYGEAANNIFSSPAGRFGVHGAFAGVELPRYTMVAARASPRHEKDGRLAVAVAAGAAMPGGSDGRLLYSEAANNISSSPAGRFGVHGALAGVELPRYTLVAAGAPPRHEKDGRLAVVVAAGATSPGECDDGLPSEDREAAVSVFRLEMELFKISQRPVALVASPTDELMDGTFGTAKNSTEMVEFLLAKVSVNKNALKELITVGQAFLIVESQAKEGYVKADALVNGIQGLKVVGKMFFEGVKLPDYSTPVVPLAADDVDKDSFFKELINVFILLYTALYWEAHNEYEFRTGGAN